MERMLGRKFNLNTMTWECDDMTPIPNEAMEEIRRPGATFLDLLFVLAWRDRIAENRKVQP
jgi:hypothetical protein